LSFSSTSQAHGWNRAGQRICPCQLELSRTVAPRGMIWTEYGSDMTRFPFASALVTGASSGIGAEMAKQLGEAGVPTVLVARRGDRLQEIADRYDGFSMIEADLGTESGVEAVMRVVNDSEITIDLVVNNAGFGTSGQFADLDPLRLGDEIDLNVKALTKISHAALVAMRERGRGYLLNVSSVASFQAAPGLAVYAATKAYVTSLTEALHEEMRGTGVNVSALCPGLTKTEFQERSNTSDYEATFPNFAWTSVESVASAGLDGVAKNRTIIVPGMLYRGLVATSGVVPRSVARRLSSMASTIRT
jgi:short-subunit dehydrogenase